LEVAAILAIIGAVVVLWAIYAYNRMRTLRNRIDASWSQIDVQLRRRYDLIPNLVETVKGYAAHERQVFENVTRARSLGIEAKSVPEQAQAETMITQALRQLFAVAENYPDLKANQNFLALQEELTATEGRIAFARQFFNDTVLRYNNTIQVFPNVVIAGTFGFEQKEYFEIEDASREPVRVQF
jgi:LemA protein